MHRITVTLLGAVLALSASSAAAEDQYPNRPIRLVVAYGAGSSPDVSARVYAAALSAELRQTVFVTNSPGAAGNIALQQVAKSAPDGYTLLWSATGPLAINPWLYKNLPFDPQKDFTPLTLTGAAPTLLAVARSAPWSTVQELVAHARKNPGKLTFAHTGVGTTVHLSGELFKSMENIDVLAVPYREGGTAVSSVVSGETDFIFYHAVVLLPLVTAGKLKILATSGASRTAVAPNVPTLAESGLAGFDLMSWSMLVAPSGISASVKSRLIEAGRVVMGGEAFRTFMKKTGAEPLTRGDELQPFLAEETAKWGKIVKSSGATVE